MKKKTLGRIVVCAFALCLISTAVASKTLAAYYADIEGQGNITVASFTDLTFKKGDTNLVAGETVEFNLASTKNTNGKVMSDKIAPGDTGSFDIVIGASEVAYTYTIGMGTPTNAVPVVFYSDPAMLDENQYTGVTDQGVLLANGDSTTTEQRIPIYWKWVTTGEGDSDNDIDYADLESTFTIDLSASQDIN